MIGITDDSLGTYFLAAKYFYVLLFALWVALVHRFRQAWILVGGTVLACVYAYLVVQAHARATLRALPGNGPHLQCRHGGDSGDGALRVRELSSRVRRSRAPVALVDVRRQPARSRERRLSLLVSHPRGHIAARVEPLLRFARGERGKRVTVGAGSRRLLRAVVELRSERAVRSVRTLLADDVSAQAEPRPWVRPHPVVYACVHETANPGCCPSASSFVVGVLAPLGVPGGRARTLSRDRQASRSRSRVETRVARRGGFARCSCSVHHLPVRQLPAYSDDGRVAHLVETSIS